MLFNLKHHRVSLRQFASAMVAFALLVTCSCVNVASNRPGPIDADASQEFTQTASGLKYRVLRKSEGRKPTSRDIVKVHYAGWLDDTTEFDSSYGRGKPAEFPLSGVVAGWTEGLQLVGEGGMIELEVPPDLGYGAGGMPPTIPPNATLHFKVELLEVR